MSLCYGLLQFPDHSTPQGNLPAARYLLLYVRRIQKYGPCPSELLCVYKQQLFFFQTTRIPMKYPIGFSPSLVFDPAVVANSVCGCDVGCVVRPCVEVFRKRNIATEGVCLSGARPSIQVLTPGFA